MRSILYLIFAVLIMCFSASCDGKSKEENVDEKTVETPMEKPTPPGQAADPVQKIIDTFTKHGITLSDEQIAQIKERSKSFDLSGESTYERRVKYKEFMDEVTKSILTEEQRQTVKEKKSSRS